MISAAISSLRLKHTTLKSPGQEGWLAPAELARAQLAERGQATLPDLRITDC